MHNQPTCIALAGIVTVSLAAAATAGSPGSVLLGDSNWDSFTAAPATASFAWAGEVEAFAAATGLLGQPQQAVQWDESVVDVELMTGLAAPEPPALVLAGMAFGGVLCGRSLLRRRRAAQAAGTHSDGDA
jgi:hypothetical protein